MKQQPIVKQIQEAYRGQCSVLTIGRCLFNISTSSLNHACKGTLYSRKDTKGIIDLTSRLQTQYTMEKTTKEKSQQWTKHNIDN